MSATNLVPIQGTEEHWLLYNGSWYFKSATTGDRWVQSQPRPEVLNCFRRNNGAESITYHAAWDNLAKKRRVVCFVNDANPYAPVVHQPVVQQQTVVQPVVQPVLVLARRTQYSEPAGPSYFGQRRSVQVPSEGVTFGQLIGGAVVVSAIGTAVAKTVRLLKG